MNAQQTSSSSGNSNRSGAAAMWVALTGLAHLALVSSAIETFRAGSPVRWWVLGFVIAYLAGGAIAARSLPRVRDLVTSGGLAIVASGLLLGLLALTAWLPGGLTSGLRLFGQSTSTVLAVVSAIFVAEAGWSLVRVRALPSWARYILGGLATYGVASFLLAVVDATPFPDLLRGASLWQRLPSWLQGAFLGVLVVMPASLAVHLLSVAAQIRRQEPTLATVHRATALLMALVMALAGISLPRVRTNDSTVSSGEGSLTGTTAGVSLSGQSRDGANADPILQALDSIQKEIPAETFDVHAVIQSAGQEPVKLFEWVRDHTYWVPYHGALRGPAGVLMDRLGNSLDRALLLCELLRTAGRTVRLAHGTIPAESGRRLLTRVRHVPLGSSTQSAPAVVNAAAKDVDRYASEYQIGRASCRERV